MQHDANFLARPDLHGHFGMCASTHWLASSTAQAVLERGGNAFDAAVAAGFVLHVVEPHLNGPGGDLVALVAPRSGDPQVLVGQGPAPTGASIDHFRSEGLDLVPGSGALAAAVPGAVDALLSMLRDLGSWEIVDVVEFAVSYAERGHPVLSKESATIAVVAEMFRNDWPSSAAVWLPGDRVPQPGESLRNPAYGETMRRLAASAVGDTREARIDAARREWRCGFVASAIESFVATTPHRHASGSVHRGVISGDDLAAFEASYEKPVVGSFRGVEILKAGAWSQGPMLLQVLAILDLFDDEELDLATPDGVHLVLEALKLALADRDAYYGERLSADAVGLLLSPDYAARRRSEIGPEASAAFRPGRLGDLVPFMPPLVPSVPTSEAAGTGEPTVTATGVMNGDTCHVDVVDRWGNMVSMTPSGGWLQSSPLIPSLGFALGTRLQMTWLDPLSPSALAPGRRPRTTLTPTLVRCGGDVVSALGSPGGDQQDQWQALYLVRTLAGRLSPQQAIEAPAFNTTSFPGSFWPRTWTPGGALVEDRLGDGLIGELESRGHRVARSGPWSLGRLSSVSRDPRTGLVSAAANPRGAQGYAVGR